MNTTVSNTLYVLPSKLKMLIIKNIHVNSMLAPSTLKSIDCGGDSDIKFHNNEQILINCLYTGVLLFEIFTFLTVLVLGKTIDLYEVILIDIPFIEYLRFMTQKYNSEIEYYVKQYNTLKVLGISEKFHNNVNLNHICNQQNVRIINTNDFLNYTSSKQYDFFLR